MRREGRKMERTTVFVFLIFLLDVEDSMVKGTIGWKRGPMR